MKKINIIVTILLLIFLMTGCSSKKIYSNEGMDVYILDKEQEKELYVDTRVSAIQMSEDAREILTEGDPLSEYHVQLSDGRSVEFIGAENAEPSRYACLYQSMSDMATALHMNILACSMAIYPESDRNLLLLYNSREATATVSSAHPSIGKNYQISDMKIYLCFGTDDHYRSTLSGITDEINHEIYQLNIGEEAHLLYDLSVGKAMVIVRTTGAYYAWKLENVSSEADLYEFADSLCWIESSDVE